MSSIYLAYVVGHFLIASKLAGSARRLHRALAWRCLLTVAVESQSSVSVEIPLTHSVFLTDIHDRYRFYRRKFRRKFTKAPLSNKHQFTNTWKSFEQQVQFCIWKELQDGGCWRKTTTKFVLHWIHLQRIAAQQTVMSTSSALKATRNCRPRIHVIQMLFTNCDADLDVRLHFVNCYLNAVMEK